MQRPFKENNQFKHSITLKLGCLTAIKKSQDWQRSRTSDLHPGEKLVTRNGPQNGRDHEMAEKNFKRAIINILDKDFTCFTKIKSKWITDLMQNTEV